MSSSRNRLSGPAVIARIARLITRHARLVVAIWIALVAVLAIHGRDAESKLAIHPLLVAGSGVERAHEISQR